MKNYKWTPAVLISVALLSACDDEKEYEIYQTPDIAYEQNVQSMEFAGNVTSAYQTLKITSARHTVLTVNKDWTNPSIVEFTPHYDFRYDFLPDASLIDRTTTAHISVDGVEKGTLKIHQTPADPGFLGIGWNLGNHFETSDMSWGYWDGATPTAALYQNLANCGFSTVRIPVTWSAHMNSMFQIDASFMAEVLENVDNALAAGLNVIINTHHDVFETTLGAAIASPADSAYWATMITNTWTQIATAMADRSQKLIFETFNEVHDGDNWSTDNEDLFEAMNNWNQIAVNAIRATGGNNATRLIGIPGYACNADMTLAHLELPNDPGNNLAVAVHSYDPYNFCIETSTNSWGSDAEKAAIKQFMYNITDQYLNNGIKVYIGEFGCCQRENPVFEHYRQEWLYYFTRMARTYGLSLFLWDNMALGGGKESHAYIDHNTGMFVNDAAVDAYKNMYDAYFVLPPKEED